MTYICGDCGAEHSEMTRYFMWRVPKISEAEIEEFGFDNEFMCRVGDERHFINCELALPFKSSNEDPLGFVGWVEVSRDAYIQYGDYRENESSLQPFDSLVDGRLANPIPSIPDSLGIPVKFQVVAEDPTPYIVWVQEETSLSTRMRIGATPEFWHAASGLTQPES